MRLTISFMVSILLAGSCGFCPPAQAAGDEPIRRAVADFLDAQSKTLPGPARFAIGPINASGVAAGCRAIAVSLPAGARPWGRTHVNARCTEGAAWSLYVPVEIHVSVDYLVSARPVRAGQTITAADIALRHGDLADLPGGVLTDPTQAIGLSSSVSLPAERPLRADFLRKPVVVKQGQAARVVSGGAGFQVANEGRALGNAVAGQVVEVRLASGQVISGVAQGDGTVRVTQ